MERASEYDRCQKAGIPYKGSPIFISGAGGCGKSFLLDVIKLELHYRFAGDNLNSMTSLTTASTGTAATLIDGTTLHNALSLPRTMDMNGGYTKLSNKRRNTMRTQFADLTTIIVSMIGQPTLYMMNQRLNEIFGVKDDNVIFGGIITIFVGDLMQLRPVKARTVFDKEPSRMLGAESAVVDLWGEVRMVELKELMRTKGDPEWGELLGRVRTGKHTEKDVQRLQANTLEKRGLKPDDPAILALTHIFPTNAEVDRFNKAKTEALVKKKQEEYMSKGRNIAEAVLDVKAKTTLADPLQAKYFKGNVETLASARADDTGGLLSRLRLVQGMRVALRQNVAVKDKLANGSIGTLRGWTKPEYAGAQPKFIFIEFDTIGGKNVGLATRAAFLKSHPKLKAYLKDPNVVPIQPYTADFRAVNRKHQLRRIMFPIAVSFASTIHRVQGATFDKLVMSLSKKVFQAAQAYTALSRLTSIDGLYLLDFDPSCLRADQKAVGEMERLRKVSGLPLENPLVLHNHPRVATKGTPRAIKRSRQQPALPTPPHQGHIIATPSANIASASEGRPSRRLAYQNTEYTGKNFIPLLNPSVHCFCNAAVQCLLTHPLCIDWLSDGTRTDVLKDQLRPVAALASPSGCSPQNLSHLIHVISDQGGLRFDDGHQQDSSEFFARMLQAAPDLDRKFRFQDVFRSQCGRSTCGETVRREPSSILVLHPPESGTTSFQELLDLELKQEAVQGKCDSCSPTTPINLQRTREVNIQEATGLLVRINMFQSETVPGEVVKIQSKDGSTREVPKWRHYRCDSKISEFDPDEMEVYGSKWATVGAVTHTGHSANSGHYVAFTREGAGGSWLEKNDTHCRRVSNLPKDLHNVSYIVLRKLDENSSNVNEETETRSRVREDSVEVGSEGSVGGSSERVRIPPFWKNLFGIPWGRNAMSPDRLTFNNTCSLDNFIFTTLNHSRMNMGQVKMALGKCGLGEILKTLALMCEGGPAEFWKGLSFIRLTVADRLGLTRGPYNNYDFMEKSGFESDIVAALFRGTTTFHYTLECRNECCSATTFTRLEKSLHLSAVNKTKFSDQLRQQLRVDGESMTKCRECRSPTSILSIQTVKNVPPAFIAVELMGTEASFCTDYCQGAPREFNACGASYTLIGITVGLDSKHFITILRTKTGYISYDGMENFAKMMMPVEDVKGFFAARPGARPGYAIYGVTLIRGSKTPATGSQDPQDLGPQVSEGGSSATSADEDEMDLTDWTALNVLPQPPLPVPPPVQPHPPLPPVPPRVQPQRPTIVQSTPAQRLVPIPWPTWGPMHKAPRAPNPNSPVAKHLNARISLVTGDITTLQVDAIVNAANGALRGGDGIDGVIHKRAGPRLFQALTAWKGCHTGQAVTTPGFNIPVRHIIHAVGPVYSFASPATSATELASAYKSALTEALKHGCRTVAFPCISIGIFGYPSNDAADVAAGAVRAFLQGLSSTSTLSVVFCLYKQTDEGDYAAALPAHFPLS